MPDRLVSLVVLVGFWVPPLLIGRAAAAVARRSAAKLRPATVFAGLAAMILAYSTAWFLIGLAELPPYVLGDATDPAFAPPGAVNKLALVTAALVLPGSAIACWLGFRTRAWSATS